jgi:hypothetical protein
LQKKLEKNLDLKKMKEEKKVVHEVKLDKSIIKLLWVFAVVLLLNAVPDEMIIPQAYAQSGEVQGIRLSNCNAGTFNSNSQTWNCRYFD